MIYILIGEMGIGKNYVGERLASMLNCKFIDGDDFLTPSMKTKVEAFKPLSESDLDEYMRVLVDSIAARSDANLVVAQALYRRKHRAFVHYELIKRNQEVRFIWVTAPFITHMKRLLSRNFRWLLYGLFNKLFFQKPRNVFRVANDNQNLDGRLINTINEKE